MPNSDMIHAEKNESPATKHPRSLADMFKKVSESSSINQKNCLVRPSERDIMRQKRKR